MRVMAPSHQERRQQRQAHLREEQKAQQADAEKRELAWKREVARLERQKRLDQQRARDEALRSHIKRRQELEVSFNPRCHVNVVNARHSGRQHDLVEPGDTLLCFACSLL